MKKFTLLNFLDFVCCSSKNAASRGLNWSESDQDNQNPRQKEFSRNRSISSMFLLLVLFLCSNFMSAQITL
ncbi:MAG: hypothetical protein V4648_06840, partial [Bacteroidota bacterium]